MLCLPFHFVLGPVLFQRHCSSLANCQWPRVLCSVFGILIGQSLSAQEWRRGKGQARPSGGPLSSLHDTVPCPFSKVYKPCWDSRTQSFLPARQLAAAVSPADLSLGTQWRSFPRSSFPWEVRAIIVKRDIVNSVPSATPRLWAEKFVFSARKKKNIYLMNAEQKVFPFPASGLKPILDQEGISLASEIIWMGKCLVLTTLCPHPGIVQGDHHRGVPPAPKFVHQPYCTHPARAFSINLNLVVLLSDGSALLYSGSISWASQTLWENPLQAELWVLPHLALGTAENPEDRDWGRRKMAAFMLERLIQIWPIFASSIVG